MVFELEHGSLITSVAWHIMSIPFENGQRISAETYGLVGVFPHDLGFGAYTHSIIIYIQFYIAAF